VEIACIIQGVILFKARIFCFPKRNDSLLFLREYAINRIRVSCCPNPFRKLQFKDYVNPVLYIENTNGEVSEY
jgi:hypothetical protein